MQDGPQKSFHGRMYFKGDNVYIGTDIPTGHVYAFDKDTGNVKWKHNAGLGVQGDIVGAKNRIYALTKADTLLCMDRSDGSVLWKFHTGSLSNVSNDSSPCLAGRRLFFRGVNSHVYAFEAVKGDLIWELKFPAELSTSICERDGDLLVGGRDGKVYMIDAKKGEIKTVLSIGEIPTGTILHAGKRVMFFTGERGTGSRIYAVDPELKKIVWRQAPGVDSYWSTYRMHVWKDRIVVGNNDGDVVAFRITDGEGCGWLTVPGVVKTITHSGEQLFVGTFQGVLYSFRIRE